MNSLKNYSRITDTAIQFNSFTSNVVYILPIFVSVIFLLAAQAKERIHRLIQSGVESGAKLLLDGRNIVVGFISSTAHSKWHG